MDGNRKAGSGPKPAPSKGIWIGVKKLVFPGPGPYHYALFDCRDAGMERKVGIRFDTRTHEAGGESREPLL